MRRIQGATTSRKARDALYAHGRNLPAIANVERPVCAELIMKIAHESEVHLVTPPACTAPAPVHTCALAARARVPAMRRNGGP